MRVAHFHAELIRRAPSGYPTAGLPATAPWWEPAKCVVRPVCGCEGCDETVWLWVGVLALQESPPEVMVTMVTRSIEWKMIATAENGLRSMSMDLVCWRKQGHH